MPVREFSAYVVSDEEMSVSLVLEYMLIALSNYLGFHYVYLLSFCDFPGILLGKRDLEVLFQATSGILLLQ